MTNIPTAEDFILEYELGNTKKVDIEDAKEALIEFAKQHVEAALKAAAAKAIEIQKPDSRKYVSKMELIASYPLENIK